MNLDKAKDILEGIGLEDKVTDEIVEACNMVLDALNEAPVCHNRPAEQPAPSYPIPAARVAPRAYDNISWTSTPFPMPMVSNLVPEPDRSESLDDMVQTPETPSREFPDGEGNY
jgi:hypothetical protein